MSRGKRRRRRMGIVAPLCMRRSLSPRAKHPTTIIISAPRESTSASHDDDVEVSQ